MAASVFKKLKRLLGKLKELYSFNRQISVLAHSSNTMVTIRIKLVSVFLAFSFSTGSKAFRVCEYAAPPSNIAAESFRHKRNSLMSIFQANHSGNDTVVALGKDAHIESKFCYGMVGKDLFDEYVEVWVDDCSGEYKLLHRGLTDSSGRLSWSLPTNLLESSGEYRIWMRVVADGSSVMSTLRILEPGSKVVIFDIDGTLTTIEDQASLEVISDFIGGNYSPPTRDFAAELSRHLHKDKECQIVYLSGRHYLLNNMTRIWLARNDFAPGSVMITQSIFDLYPSNSSVGQFKLKRLKQITESGLEIVRAYGNAKTDIFAYKGAGLSSDQIYIVGTHSGTDGTSALGDDFSEHYYSLVNGGSV